MDETANLYRIWSDKLSAEPPMELPALVNAIKSRRVQADTWLYLDHEKRWVQAGQVPDLKLFFKRPASAPETSGSQAAGAAKQGLKAGHLRRIKLMAGLEESQLERFLQLMEVLSFKQFASVVTAGEHGDSMFLVLEGEVRARNMLDGRETTLATMGVGDFFGEIALLDHGPRSADVLANQPSVLLKISAESIERLVRESPEVGAAFLLGLSRAIVGRLRGVTKKYQDTIHMSRVAGGVA